MASNDSDFNNKAKAYVQNIEELMSNFEKELDSKLKQTSNQGCATELTTDKVNVNQILVKYGKKHLVKGTPEYYDMRERNKQAIKICRDSKKLELLRSENEQLEDKIKCLIDYHEKLKAKYWSVIQSDENYMEICSIIESIIDQYNDL